jgi:hypothetical protein
MALPEKSCIERQVSRALATVRITEDLFEIYTRRGEKVFSASLDSLVLELCLLEPRLAQFLTPPDDADDLDGDYSDQADLGEIKGWLQ